MEEKEWFRKNIVGIKDEEELMMMEQEELEKVK